jgi:hypothetical protein
MICAVMVGNMRWHLGPVFVLTLVAACGTNPRYCDETTECGNPQYVCDLQGVCPESEGLTNSCIPPTAICWDGGTAGAADAGDGGGGAPDSIGCLGEGLGFVPSNFAKCDVVGPNPARTFGLPGVWTLGTEGILVPPTGPNEELQVAVVNQGDGLLLTVIAFADLDIPSTVTLAIGGDRPVALVSLADIDVAGTVSAAATSTDAGVTSGPGGDLDILYEWRRTWAERHDRDQRVR